MGTGVGGPLDHGTPVPLRRFFPSHQVSTASAEGWASFQNGDLLVAVEASFALALCRVPVGRLDRQTPGLACPGGSE